MIDNGILLGLALLGCVGLSFLFSGMETGVLALNRFRIRQRMKTGDRPATRLHHFLENPENFLWTILVGNTVANVTIFSLGAWQIHHWLGKRPWLWLLAFATGLMAFYIVCELVPKTLFQRYPTRMSILLALPFSWIHKVLSPLVTVVDWFSCGLLRLTGGKIFNGRLFGSREELRFIMQESGPGLTSDETAMINRVLDLPNVRVRQVMVPWSRTVSVRADEPLSRVLAVCRERNLTRLPVTDPTSRRVIGLINLDRVLYLPELDASHPASFYSQVAFFLPEELHLEEALHSMQRTGSRLAVVVGAGRRETGILTLQDILKVIFGEMNL